LPTLAESLKQSSQVKWVYGFAVGLQNVTQTQKSSASLVKCTGNGDLFCVGVRHEIYLMDRLNIEYYLGVMKQPEAVRIKRPGFLEVKKNGFTMTLLLHIPQCS
jgi:hypothetical protein